MKRTEDIRQTTDDKWWQKLTFPKNVCSSNHVTTLYIFTVNFQYRNTYQNQTLNKCHKSSNWKLSLVLWLKSFMYPRTTVYRQLNYLCTRTPLQCTYPVHIKFSYIYFLLYFFKINQNIKLPCIIFKRQFLQKNISSYYIMSINIRTLAK